MFCKKVLCLLLALVMAFSIAACGKQNETEPATGSAQTTTQGQAGTDGTTNPDATSGSQIENAMTPGTLNSFRLAQGELPVLRGLRLAGNRCGGEEINAREPATEGIRCIFELNEWVEFYPDTDVQENLRVWVIRHGAEPRNYETETFSDQMPGFVQYCDLANDPEADEGSSWGSFYLNPEDAEAGDYDFVFTYEGRPIATLLTRFYHEGELEGKSDTELEKLMRES